MKWELIAIGIAGFMGLTILAFRHAFAYRIAPLIVIFIGFASWGMLGGYNAGLEKGFRAAVPFVPIEKMKPLSDRIDSAAFNADWFPAVSIIGVSYQLFLLWLPILIPWHRGEYGAVHSISWPNRCWLLSETPHSSRLSK